MMPFVRTIS